MLNRYQEQMAHFSINKILLAGVSYLILMFIYLFICLETNSLFCTNVQFLVSFYLYIFSGH